MLVFLNPSKLYPIIKERWKNATDISSESEATSSAGYTIKFPSKVPDDYKLQLGVVETAPDDTKFVFLFYSKEPLIDSMRLNEFFKKDGIWIIYRRWASSEEGSFESRVKDYLRTLQRNKVEACEITINGNKGIFANQNDRLLQGYYDVHDPSKVEFVMDETHVTIDGYFAKEDLIKVAESIK